MKYFIVKFVKDQRHSIVAETNDKDKAMRFLKAIQKRFIENDKWRYELDVVYDDRDIDNAIEILENEIEIYENTLKS